MVKLKKRSIFEKLFLEFLHQKYYFMKNSTTKIANFLLSILNFVKDSTIISKYRVSTNDFIRNRYRNFVYYAELGISGIKKSLSAELFNLLEYTDLETVSKSAYSQARYKIKAELYKDWNDHLIKLLYKCSATEKMYDLKQYKGYFIDAVDGSVLTLPQTASLKAHFGTQQGGSELNPSYTVMGRVVFLTDVLNKHVLDSVLTPISISERATFEQMIPQLRTNAINVFDRGFASFHHFKLLLAHEKEFLFRVKINFNTEIKKFHDSDLQDTIITLKAPKNNKKKENLTSVKKKM